ncbi:MAG: hypothetical protein DHS20C11_21310 [Lysobacteraceae bacterium]|nr:MAG: hypothetical protein DHS20C11_21310 [Xanthomonadaceae bacterium]
MTAAIAGIAVLTMFIMTFIVYRAFGPRNETLLPSDQEKLTWTELVSGSLGTILAKTSIFATLTSLATVYVFFIGNTRVFGFWILFAIVTLLVGAYVTVALSRRIVSARPMAQTRPSRALIADLVAGDDADSVRTRALVNGLMVVYLLVILLLEFSVFSHITADLVGGTTGEWLGPAIFFFVLYLVSLFTLKYGMRGFVYADLFQSPFLVLGSIIVLGGAFALLYSNLSNAGPLQGFQLVGNELATPRVPIYTGLVFAASALVLNSFLVCATPAHWARMWIFGSKTVLNAQVPATWITALVWLFLVIVGATLSASFSIQEGAESFIAGERAVAWFLSELADVNAILLFFFWLAAVAALFSTADTQLFCLVLSLKYSPSRRELKSVQNVKLPALWSILIAVTFTGLFTVLQDSNLLLDKIVFVTLPACLVIVPTLVGVAFGFKRLFLATLISTIGYLAIGAVALTSKEQDYAWTVVPPLFPLLVAATLFAQRRFGLTSDVVEESSK